jgi:hypothetical protein
MDNRFHVHNDIEDAASFYKIPLAMWHKDDVYVLQEDRCVFVGKPNITIKWMQNNEGKFCQSRFPLNAL